MLSYSTAALTARGAPALAAGAQLLGIAPVVAMTGLSRSSLYAYMAKGIFPRPRKLGPRRVAWTASEVQAWITSRAVAGGVVS